MRSSLPGGERGWQSLPPPLHRLLEMGTRSLTSAAVTYFISSQAAALSPPSLPLRTQGGNVIDATSKVVMFDCVNWYGAHMPQMVSNGLNVQPLAGIAKSIVDLGFNCVRLPYSLDLVLGNFTQVPDPAVSLAANPDLQRKSPMEVFDLTLEALTKEGLMVIVNNHVSSSGWCCSIDDGQGLWYTDEYPAEVWLDSVSLIAERYANNSLVTGFDLRNEIRPAGDVVPTWGTGDHKTDWALAAEAAAQRVLAKNNNMLVIVSGLDFSKFLCDLPKRPIHQTAPLHGRIVYTAHEYPWFDIHVLARTLMEYTCVAVAAVLAVVTLGIVICPLLEGHRLAKGRFCSPLCHCFRRTWSIFKCVATEGETIACAQWRRCWLSLELFLAVAMTVLATALLSIEPVLVERCHVPFSEGIIFMVVPIVAAVLLWMRVFVGLATGGQVAPRFCCDVEQEHLALTAATLSLQPFSSTLVQSLTVPETSTEHAEVASSGEVEVSASSTWYVSCMDATRFSAQRPVASCCRWRALLIGTAVLLLVALWSYMCYSDGTYEAFRTELDERWGFIRDPSADDYDVEAAPVWLGEFGTNVDDTWWSNVLSYLKDRPVGWAYWSINGQKTNTDAEVYGIYNEDMKTIRDPWKLQELQEIMEVRRQRYAQVPTLNVTGDTPDQ